MLASYAVRVEDSRGRRYPEPPHPYRNPFQRDRDRVIHARAFRRLENKTQVFTRRYSDHFRTRLTHTMEVAQISRTIAGELQLNVDLAEALALVHDLGHPPFGHAGERTLDLLMHEHGESFDHNLQALRTVEEIELRYIEFHGLNLTFEVREGIIKHSRDYSSADHPELSEYLLDQRPPLEAQLIDLTDEIAYSTADMDDGYESKLLKLNDIRQGVPVFERYFVEVERRYPDAPEKLKFNEALKQVLNRFVTDLIAGTRARVQQSSVNSLEELRAHAERLAGFSPEVEQERRQAKAFLYRALYNCKQLEPEKRQAEKVITEVFRHLMAHPEALPHAYRERTANEKLARVVCDYIAGMTDHYIQDLRKKLAAKPTAL
jgi:dGTPase